MKCPVQECKSEAIYVPNQKEALVPDKNKLIAVNGWNGKFGLGPSVPKVIDIKCY